jgi:putative ribosome biogenesis GTPase RsgA
MLHEAETVVKQFLEQIMEHKSLTRRDLFDRVVVLLTKSDEASDKQRKAFLNLALGWQLHFLCVSSKTDLNIDTLRSATAHMGHNVRCSLGLNVPNKERRQRCSVQ